MLITAGANKGEHVDPHQWANDWISIRDVPGYRAILSPRNVRLSPSEIAMFRASASDPHLGQFWTWWRLEDDGTFTDLRVPPPRTIRHSAEEMKRERDR